MQRLSSRAGNVLEKLDKLIDENSNSLSASVKNIETFSKTLADNSEPTASLIKDSAAFMHTLRPVAEKFDHLIASADKTVKALDPKTVKNIADNLAGLSENINKFTRDGPAPISTARHRRAPRRRHAQQGRAQFRTRSVPSHLRTELGAAGSAGSLTKAPGRWLRLFVSFPDGTLKPFETRVAISPCNCAIERFHIILASSAPSCPLCDKSLQRKSLPLVSRLDARVLRHDEGYGLSTLQFTDGELRRRGLRRRSARACASRSTRATSRSRSRARWTSPFSIGFRARSSS